MVCAFSNCMGVLCKWGEYLLKVVQPIRDAQKLHEVLDYLKATNERNYIMFLVGIHTAFRISDILKLKVKDVRGDYITIREEKRDKLNRTLIHPKLKRALRHYIADRDDEEYLIKSREGDNKPISRYQAYRIIRGACESCGVYEVGTHTLRKTFGYHMYRQTRDIALLQQILNHDDEAYTLRYIGINQDSRDDAIRKFSFPSV